jgi:hypothetical protein
MSDEELIETLREFEKNRVENLNESARNLFYAIMRIANERDMLQTQRGKTIKYIKENAWYCYKDNEENLDRIGIEHILKLLGDEENETNN